MGAIASGGIRVMNQRVLSRLDISRKAIDDVVAAQMKELRRREIAYRGHPGAPEIKNKIVILVDDGIATGSTIRAAVQALRQQDAKKIVIAVPTAAPESCDVLEPDVDELIALIKPEEFQSVGQWYEEFAQTTDDQVTQILAEAASHG